MGWGVFLSGKEKEKKKGFVAGKKQNRLSYYIFFSIYVPTYIQKLRNQVLYIGGSSTTGTGRVPYVLYPYCREVLYHI